MTSSEGVSASPARERWGGHVAMALFALFISGSFSLGSRAAPFIDPNAMMAARFILASGVLLGVLIARRAAAGVAPRETLASLRILARAPWRFAVLGVLYGTYFVLMFEALRLAEPAVLGAIFTLTPLMSAGFALLFARQGTPASVLLALAIGGAGAVWVIFRGDPDALLGLQIGLGEILFFIGAASHAAYTPLVRVFNRGETGPVFVLGATTAAMVFVVLIGARSFLATEWSTMPGVVWISLFYLAIVTTAGTATLLQYAAMKLSAPRVMAYTYLVPTFVILLEGISGAGWAEAAILPGVAATLVSLGLLLRE